MKKLLIINHHYDSHYHSDLEIRAVVLDQLMKEPEAPSKECLLDFEVKTLRPKFRYIRPARDPLIP